MKRLFLIVLLFSAIGAVWAAENPNPTQDPPQTDNPDNTGSADSELVFDETDSDPEAEDEESPDRFIPTEEISQDLGVSFPVDI